MSKNVLGLFGGILSFITGNKNFINKKEAQKIFYSKEHHFKEALQDAAKIKEKASNLLTEEATENSISIAEQIALTVNVK